MSSDSKSPSAGRRTGPDKGGARGTDLPSSRGVRRDTRTIEGASGTPNRRSPPGRAAADPRDLKERADEAEAVHGSAPESAGAPSPSPTGAGPAGPAAHDAPPAGQREDR